MHIRIADHAIAGIWSGCVYQPTRDGANVLVAQLRNRDKAWVEKWSNAIAADVVPQVDDPAPVEQAPPEPGPLASVAAKTLAANNDVDLSDVPHDGDKITKPDVDAYILKRTGDHAVDEDPGGDDNDASPSTDE